MPWEAIIGSVASVAVFLLIAWAVFRAEEND